MRFRRPVTRTKDLLAMRTITRYPQRCRWALRWVGGHLWLGRGGTIGWLLSFLGKSWNVVDDFELATLLGWPTGLLVVFQVEVMIPQPMHAKSGDDHEVEEGGW